MAKGMVSLKDWETAVVNAMKDNNQAAVLAAVGRADEIADDELLLSVTARCNFLLTLSAFMKVRPWQRMEVEKLSGHLMKARDGALAGLLARGWTQDRIEATIAERMNQPPGGM